MTHVHLLTNSHAATSPRVVREANALAAAGYAVTVSGVWLQEATAADDLTLAQRGGWTFRPTIDLRRGMTRTLARATRRIARGVQRPSVHALVYGAHALANAAESVTADALRLHLEAGLWIAATRGKRLPPWGVDIEDWHSENDPDATDHDAMRLWLRRIEGRVLLAARHATTTSAALASGLAVAYRVAVPDVIPNVAPDPAFVAPPPPHPPRLLWMSQTVGRGRGLEVLFDALRTLEMPWRLTLMGHVDDGTRRWVDEALGPMAARVDWQAFVQPWALDAVIAAHHIALALEIPACRNKDLTASNKLFHGLQHGLRVVATDTAGQREMLQRVAGTAAPVTAGDVRALRNAVAAALDAARHEADPLAARRARRDAAAAAFPSRDIEARWVDATARLLRARRT